MSNGWYNVTIDFITCKIHGDDDGWFQMYKIGNGSQSGMKNT